MTKDSNFGEATRPRRSGVVWTDMEGLEEAYAVLPQSQCHFLVGVNDFEAMPILAGVYGRSAMERLHDRNREVEFGSLHRISDELAEFARALARIAESEGQQSFTDKPVSYRPASMGSFHPFATVEKQQLLPSTRGPSGRSSNIAGCGTAIRCRPFRRSRLGHIARPDGSGARRTQCVGTELVYCCSRAADYRASLDHQYDRKWHVVARTRPQRCAPGIHHIIR